MHPHDRPAEICCRMHADNNKQTAGQLFLVRASVLCRAHLPEQTALPDNLARPHCSCRHSRCVLWEGDCRAGKQRDEARRTVAPVHQPAPTHPKGRLNPTANDLDTRQPTEGTVSSVFRYLLRPVQQQSCVFGRCIRLCKSIMLSTQCWWPKGLT